LRVSGADAPDQQRNKGQAKPSHMPISSSF
jgi:hypothetical protein